MALDLPCAFFMLCRNYSDANQSFVHHVQAALRIDPDMDVSTVALDLPCTFFMLRADRALPIVEPVAKTLVWSPAINRLADKVVAGLRKRIGESSCCFL